jgi:hypothetical protein
MVFAFFVYIPWKGESQELGVGSWELGVGSWELGVGFEGSPEINYPFGTLRERAESFNPFQWVKKIASMVLASFS